MNTAWNRWCRNLPSGTALSLYDNRITPIIITDITGRRNVRIQNPYTSTTSSGPRYTKNAIKNRTGNYKFPLRMRSVTLNRVSKLEKGRERAPLIGTKEHEIGLDRTPLDSVDQLLTQIADCNIQFLYKFRKLFLPF